MSFFWQFRSDDSDGDDEFFLSLDSRQVEYRQREKIRRKESELLVRGLKSPAIRFSRLHSFSIIELTHSLTLLARKLEPKEERVERSLSIIII